MRRRVAGAFAAAIVLAAGWVAWTASARPALRLDPEAVDFGPLGRRTTLVVTVRNDGRAPLRILALSSSCGCTTAAIDRREIPPRGAARLAITFDPAAHGPQTGPARHAVYVRTDDPREPEAEVEVRAVVLKGAAQ